MHRVTAPARAGIAGNPSDAYGGAAVAVPVPALTATVEVADADALRITGPEVSWPDLGALVEDTTRYGHEGGDRLVTAAIATLAQHTGVRDDAFEVRWSTGIPRSVGLAGSSAVVVATMQALLERWAVELTPVEVARLALRAEQESLGIAAGLMDRAVQAHGGPVLVDGDDVRALAAVAVPNLVVAWRSAAAGPSQGVHGPLRQRFQDDAEVRSTMARLAEVGRQAAVALEHGDDDALAAAMAQTFSLRVGLDIVSDEIRAMVDALATIGAAATSAGSGGAVVGLLRGSVSLEDVERVLAGQCDGVTAARWA